MNHRQGLRAALSVSVAAIAITAALPAFADTPAAQVAPAANSTGDTPDITITARLKPETEFDVPQPVTAISGATLQQFDITDMKSVIDLVPNAELPKSPDNYELYINVRGIQETDAQAQPNFGTYRNGIYAGGERPNVGSLIDVERVEIDAGPQSGLYGRDAVGGAINVIYATPSQKREGYLTASYGTWDTTELQGAINMPVSDTFAVRATGWFLNQAGGELYNATLHQIEDKYTRSGGRISAKFTPNDKFTGLWMVEYDNNAGPATESYAPNGITNGTVTSQPETKDVIYRDTPDRDWNNQVYISQDLKYQTGVGTFQWLSDYSDYHMRDIEDEDKTALGPTAGFLVGQQALHRKEEVRNLYTEVLWFSPDNWPVTVTAGASYFDQVFDFQREYNISVDMNLLQPPFDGYACGALLNNSDCAAAGIPGGTFPALGVQTTDILGPGGGTSIDTRSWSVFFDATWHINTQWSLNFAARYTDDQEALNFHQFDNPAASPGAPYLDALLGNIFPTITLVKTFPYTHFSPSAELNYKPNEHLNLYALYSTGFRAGGFNTVTTTASLIPYGSEQAENYEIGIKTLWLDNRLAVNLSAFYMVQDHLLTYEPDPIAPPQFNFFYLANIGKSGTYGVELTTIAQLKPWWTASLSVGWLDAKITQGVSYGSSEVGDPLENTRTWTINARTNVNYPLGNGYALLGGVNWRLEEGGFLDITSDPWQTLDRVDLTLGVGKGHYKLEAYVNNALDSRPTDFIYGDGAQTLVDGRTAGVRFSARF